MTHERIDFSPLDPKRNPERFERMVRNVLQGARSATPTAQLLPELLRWGRLGLAAAALLAIAVWLPRLGNRAMLVSENGLSGPDKAVALVSTWARSGEVPTNSDVIQTLGELDGR